MEKIKKINEKLDKLNYSSTKGQYNETLNSINEKMVELKQLLRLHNSKFKEDIKNYGYVGDLEYVFSQLKEAVNFLKNEE